MKTKITVLSLALIAGLWGSTAMADNDDDDIYYSPSKAKKETPIKKQSRQTADNNYSYNNYSYNGTVYYPAADTYIPSTGSGINRSVDEYNRRGIFASADTAVAAADSLGADAFASTRRIERFYNPDVVKSTDDAELEQYYYARPANVNIVINSDPWLYPYYGWNRVWGWNNPWYWGTPWNWGYGPSWAWGPSWSWNWGWGPSWAWGPSWSWGPGWGWAGPSWGWGRPVYHPRGSVGNIRRPYAGGSTGNIRGNARGNYRPGASGNYRPSYNGGSYRGNVRGKANNNRGNYRPSSPGSNNNYNYNQSTRPSYNHSTPSYNSGGSFGGSRGGGFTRGGGGGRGRH